MQYADFDEITEIGSGAYRTIYTAKYRKYSEVRNMEEIVALKRFKSFDQTPELFISEVSNNWVIVILIKVIQSNAVFISFNSSEIMPGVHMMVFFKFME